LQAATGGRCPGGEAMIPLGQTGGPRMLVADRVLLRQGVFYARVFRPQAFPDGQALHTAITAFLDAARPLRRRLRTPKPDPDARGWRVLKTHHFEPTLVARANLDTLVAHGKACARHDLPTVQAYRMAVGKWPTAEDLRRRLVTSHPYDLAWAARYLRRRGELRGRRGLLRTAKGRLWLAAQARRVLGRRWLAHVTDGGACWLFTREERPSSGGGRG